MRDVESSLPVCIIVDWL